MGRDGEVEEVRLREVGDKTTLVQDLFLQDELTPWPWLTLVAGLRYTYNSEFGHRASATFVLSQAGCSTEGSVAS